MNFSPYVRSVNIEKAPKKVAEFVKEVPNLPQWAKFFLKVGTQTPNGYPVETKIGPALTWISEEQTDEQKRLTIHSRFSERYETAQIDLAKIERGTQLSFQIHLPTEWQPEKTHSQLQQLQKELQTLKGLLEN